MEQNLLELIGGEEAVAALIEKFYMKMLEDIRVVEFFTNVDIDRLKSHQRSFFCNSLKGEPRSDMSYLARVHEPLVERGLNDDHYDVAVEHIVSSLKELNVSEDHILKIVNLLECFRSEVLGRKML